MLLSNLKWFGVKAVKEVSDRRHFLIKITKVREKMAQICKRCVMDTTDLDILFDANGICNYCLEFDRLVNLYRLNGPDVLRRLDFLRETIKSTGSARQYDCIIGLSGGVDSSYVVYLAHELGLRTLVVHVNNGWNSEIAVANIKKIVEKCRFDLQTYVIDWPEFRDLQRSFLRASVIDIEMITDHAITAAIFNFASKFKVRYVLSGNNFATEYGMPKKWLYRKQDVANILSIHRKFGKVKLKTFPFMGSLTFAIIKKFGLGFKYAEPLNIINYSKTMAMKTLQEEFSWQYYGGKHYESIFTKFYQGYILPEKFHIDKRIVHWSALIRNGEITREAVITELGKPIYLPNELKKDREYVLKKLGFSDEEFSGIMREAPKSHLYYGSDERYYRFLHRLLNILKYGRSKFTKLSPE